ncbi:MAG: HAD-IA family hydrolase [Elusimicrobia bacterium]|nr:HAD-IA family hydrolase [Elusimicrobiota bacterium]
MIKAVVFDLDNTLMDFMRMKRAAVDAAADAMIDAGLPIAKKELVEKIFTIYWKEGIEDQNIFDKVLEKEFGRVDHKILAAGIIGYRRAKDGAMTLYPHVRMTLAGLLKTGIRLGIVSDAPRLAVWLRLVTLELHHYFESVVTYDDTGKRKPSPEPFKCILERLNVPASEALMVGDWAERDIVGAKKMGMKTAWAKYGDEFKTVESGADYVLLDILDVLKVVGQENGTGACVR